MDNGTNLIRKRQKTHASEEDARERGHPKNFLEDVEIRKKFSKYWKNIEIDDASDLIDLLKTKDDWFYDIFKNDL